jgi:hypothetical protein
VENKFMMVYEKANGWWELQSLITYGELRDMGCFVPMIMRKEVY